MDKSKRSNSLVKKIIWLCLIWGASVAVLGSVSLLLRWVLKQ